MTTTINETATCPNCDGTGKLPHYSHIANGDCFACGGTGTITFKSFIGDNSDVILEVFKYSRFHKTLGGQFWHAFLRCRTWEIVNSSSHGKCKQWGKDLWCKRIDDVEEARELWRNAKITGIQTTICDD